MISNKASGVPLYPFDCLSRGHGQSPRISNKELAKDHVDYEKNVQERQWIQTDYTERVI